MRIPQVLVVDDEPLNLEIVSEFLEEEGYRLDLVESAERAWERLDAGTPCDLAILDHMMPGMSGIDLLRKMKSDRRFAHIPVIVQSAACDPRQVNEGIVAGAFRFLSKPYTLETLSAAAADALAASGLTGAGNPDH